MPRVESDRYINQTQPWNLQLQNYVLPHHHSKKRPTSTPPRQGSHGCNFHRYHHDKILKAQDGKRGVEMQVGNDFQTPSMIQYARKYATHWTIGDKITGELFSQGAEGHHSITPEEWARDRARRNQYHHQGHFQGKMKKHCSVERKTLGEKERSKTDKKGKKMTDDFRS